MKNFTPTAMRAGDTAGVYLAGDGNQTVLATARIAGVTPWNARDQRRYPLMRDGAPMTVLELVDVQYMATPVAVRTRLARLSIFAGGVPKNGASRSWVEHARCPNAISRSCSRPDTRQVNSTKLLSSCRATHRMNTKTQEPHADETVAKTMCQFVGRARTTSTAADCASFYLRVVTPRRAVPNCLCP